MSKRRDARRAREKVRARSLLAVEHSKELTLATRAGELDGDRRATARIEAWSGAWVERFDRLVTNIVEPPKRPQFVVPWPDVTPRSLGSPGAFASRMRTEMFRWVPMAMDCTSHGRTASMRWWNLEPSTEEGRRKAYPLAQKALYALRVARSELDRGWWEANPQRIYETALVHFDVVGTILTMWLGAWRDLSPEQIATALEGSA